jgi:hypothetical protein
MSLLTIVQNVCAELAIPIPGVVASNTDPTIVQLKFLSQRAGDEVARDYDWSDLHFAISFTATGTYPEPAALTADWDRFADNSVIWNNSRLWQLNGPVDPQTWQRNTVINTNPVPQIWRVFRGQLDIYPNTAGETISYEYISNYWINAFAGGTAKTWMNDGDTAIISERIIELSTMWRWKRSQGLDYGEELENFERARENEVGSDRAARPTSLNLANRGQIPDNYWPGTITVTP